MGYVDDAVTPGERVIHKGRVHWAIFLPSVFLLLLSLGSLLVKSNLPNGAPRNVAAVAQLVFAVWTLVSVGRRVLAWIFTEFAVTSRRVIAKFGAISWRTVELNHNQIEGVQVDQGVVGRALGYGTVVVTGTGGTLTPIPVVERPLEFRRIVLEAIEGDHESSA